jgi:hypothetical protein
MSSDPVFRPKADTSLLAAKLRTAWRRRWERIYGAWKDEAGSLLASHLESLYPAADMVVLARYGFAAPVSECVVTVYNRERKLWDSPRLAVPLARPVTVPLGCTALHTAAPWYADPDSGLTEAGRARMTSDEYTAYRANCAKQLQRAVSAELESWFDELAELAEGANADGSRAYQFARQFKAAHGRYPRWSEVHAAFPILVGLE